LLLGSKTKNMNLIWKYLKVNKRQVFLALGFSVISRVFSLFDFQIFRLLVDNYITKIQVISQSEFIFGVFYLLSLLAMIAVITRLTNNWQFYFSKIVVQKVGSRVYAEGITHSFTIPYQEFEDQKSGEIMQKMNNARENIQIFSVNFISVFTPLIFGIIFVVVFTFFVNLLLGVVFLITSLFLITIIYLLSRQTLEAQKRIGRESIILAGSVTETLRNVELVKGMGLEEQEIKRLNFANDELLRLHISRIKLARRLDFIQGILINLARLIILLIMLWLIYYQTITLGEFFSLFFYISFIFAPLSELGSIAMQYHEAVVGLNQLESILNIPSAVKPENGLKLENINSLSLNNVSFRYLDKGEASVKNINITVRAGETIAFVGPSGCGKTTLIKILVGLYAPEAGSLFFNQKDSVKIDFNYLRKKIGLVSQETQLFAGSIRDNLLFVKPEATEAECWEVLKNTLLLGVVERGDKGLDTVIGEGGMRLSGGERQRLAIARALLRKPDLLIFDEATSSLDVLTEKEISQTISRIEKQSSKTIIIIVSHRLSTVAHAKKIFVMNSGKIIDSGSHDELIKTNEFYASLWNEQAIINLD